MDQSNPFSSNEAPPDGWLQHSLYTKFILINRMDRNETRPAWHTSSFLSFYHFRQQTYHTDVYSYGGFFSLSFIFIYYLHYSQGGTSSLTEESTKYTVGASISWLHCLFSAARSVVVDFQFEVILGSSTFCHYCTLTQREADTPQSVFIFINHRPASQSQFHSHAIWLLLCSDSFYILLICLLFSLFIFLFISYFASFFFSC